MPVSDISNFPEHVFSSPRAGEIPLAAMIGSQG
jgi:hypothetical protein